MRRSMLQLSLVLLAALAAAPALAATRAGVTLPDQAEVAGRTLALNGLGVREATIFNVKVYVAGLYLPEKTADAAAILGKDQPWRLVMKFTRNLDRSDLTGAFEEGFEKNGAKGAEMKARVAKLQGMMRDVKKGETLTITYEPGKGTTVAAGDAAIGTIEGADFARALLSIWLGPKPPNKSLKTGLLGRG